MMRVLILAVVVLCVYAQTLARCSLDEHSFFNCDDLKVEHTYMNITVDFDHQALVGYVDIYLSLVNPSATKISLDTRHLIIDNVYLLDPITHTPQSALPWQLISPEAEVPTVFGKALVISPPLPMTPSVAVRIYYVATNESESIQFLQPSQTAGKQHPYLFTQNEAIHARSMLPCADSPAAKSTYSATIIVPAPLVAVMSAQRINVRSAGAFNIFDFEQKVVVPSYLIALGVGALESASIGPRSSLWTEKEMITPGAYEFSQTEQFIKTAESFLIPYVWGKYDLLLLVPSFPFGGMENPTLTFVTPTLLAGDRSLANVIAHEIAHSWSGNLVTNQNWKNFWLNEGFTVFTERRIIAKMVSEQEADLHALIGLNELRKDVDHYNEIGQPNLTQLIPPIHNVDPDDSFSSVPYEKGYLFLRYLSTLVGMPAFEKFLASYFDHFKYLTVNSEQMKQYFLDYFTGKVDPSVLNEIEWDKWWYSQGMPFKTVPIDTTYADQASALAQLWIDNPQQAATHTEFPTWSSQQQCYMLDTLLFKADNLSMDGLHLMDQVYHLTQTKNAEVTFRWQSLSLGKKDSSIFSAVVKFITSQGRNKFVRPLYRSLASCCGAEGRDLAVNTFVQNRGSYHPLTAKMLAQDLGIK